MNFKLLPDFVHYITLQHLATTGQQGTPKAVDTLESMLQQAFVAIVPPTFLMRQERGLSDISSLLRNYPLGSSETDPYKNSLDLSAQGEFGGLDTELGNIIKNEYFKKQLPERYDKDIETSFSESKFPGFRGMTAYETLQAALYMGLGLKQEEATPAAQGYYLGPQPEGSMAAYAPTLRTVMQIHSGSIVNSRYPLGLSISDARDMLNDKGVVPIDPMANYIGQMRRLYPDG